MGNDEGNNVSKLIYLMGPSGCGKDALISAMREQPPANLLFAHRYVTRPWKSGNENHIELSDAEFKKRRESGLFCLDWEAHGHQYGIGCEVTHWLSSGHSVLVNGSRGHLAAAASAFRDRLLPVMITVDKDRLKERLIARGRESIEAIEARLERSHLSINNPSCDYQLVDNNGRLEDALSALTLLIKTANHQP